MPRHAIGSATVAIIVLTAVAACSSPAGPSSASGAPATAPSSSTPAETASPSPTTATETAAPSESAAASGSRKPLPSIDQSELDAYLTSSVTLVDLTDGSLTVKVTYVDPTSNDAIDFGSYDLGANDQMTDQVPPGTYQLTFALADGTKVPVCSIAVGDKDAFTFAAVEGGVAVAKQGVKPGTAGELSAATSSLCGH